MSQEPVEAPLPGLGLCGCGCGGFVRERFLPGHDAKLKYRLWDEIRRGDEAMATLRRLGWEPPPETTR